MGAWQHGLRLDAPFELFVQPLDGVGGSCAFPLAGRQRGEGEEAVARFLKAVGDGEMVQPPLAQELLAPLLDLLRRVGVDHVVVVGRDLFMQPLGRVGEQVAMLVDLMPTSA